MRGSWRAWLIVSCISATCLAQAEPPPELTGDYLHDGFYVRTSFGLSYLTADVNAGYTLRGTGLAMDLLLGGTPISGLVIGGGFSASGAAQARADFSDGSSLELTGKSGGLSSSGQPAVSVISLSLFVDGFVDPTGGFHVGGAVGFWLLSVASSLPPPPRIFEDDDFRGVGLSVWVGYGGWVGKQLQLGGMLRLSAATMENEQTATATAQSFAVLFTVLHH